MTDVIDDPNHDDDADALDDGKRAGRSAPVEVGARPSALETFERAQPFIAVAVMAGTFVSMPQAFAVALVGLVWLVTTRFSRNHRFLGLTLTEALAWAATLVIIFLGLAFVLFVLGGASA